MALIRYQTSYFTKITTRNATTQKCQLRGSTPSATRESTSHRVHAQPKSLLLDMLLIVRILSSGPSASEHLDYFAAHSGCFLKNSGSASAARCGPGAAKQPSTPGPSLGNLPQRNPEQPGAVRLARIAPLSCSIPFRLPGHLLRRLR